MQGKGEGLAVSRENFSEEDEAQRKFLRAASTRGLTFSIPGRAAMSGISLFQVKKFFAVRADAMAELCL